MCHYYIMFGHFNLSAQWYHQFIIVIQCIIITMVMVISFSSYLHDTLNPTIITGICSNILNPDPM